MDEDQTRRLERSFELLKPKADLLVATFYRQLFSTHPELRSMFPDDMTGQRKKLHGALAFVVANIRKPDALRETLLNMGAKHVTDYGVTPEIYPHVRDDMVEAMSVVAGDAWNEQLEADWSRALDVVAGIMIEGGVAAVPKLKVSAGR